MTELPLHDWRIALAVLVIVFAGMVKSVTGLGIPVVGTPLLALLYGHLAIVVAIMSIPTTLCSGYFVYRARGSFRETVPVLIGLVPFGVVGVVAGTHLLVTVPTRILAGVLGGVIVVFVLNQVIRRAAPPRDARTHPAYGSAAGFLAGALQGTSGASGPLITMYLLRRPLTREGFFLAANAAFFVYDVTQAFTLGGLGQFTAPRWHAALIAIVPLFAGVFLGAGIAKRINDTVFRSGVLVILALTAVSLFVKVAT